MINSSDIFNAKILIVDDSEDDVRLLERALQSVGYTSVTSTMNPFGVCELYRKYRYDLILLDIFMPGMDGFEVIKCLKGIEPDGYLPVFVVMAEPDYKLRALKAGARDFISKPFDVVELKMRVYNMLEVRLLFKKLEHYSKEMESMAQHDALTGLPNRRLLMDRLSMSVAHARRNKNAMAVLSLDLDGFKEVNDTLGHEAGDILLKMVAGRLAATVRRDDTVARLGGDEFVIALEQLGHADSVPSLVSKVIQAVSKPYNIQGRAINMTTSVGVGIYPTHGDDVDKLMKSADLALYDAKHTGKNMYRISAPSNSIDISV